MRAVRVLKTGITVNLPALEYFLQSFHPSMVNALIDLVELGAEHPNFGQPGFPGGTAYDDADEATDYLMYFFVEEYAADETPEMAPLVTLDFRHAALTIRDRWYRPPSRRKGARAPVPDLRRAFNRVPVRILKKPDAKN